MNQILVYVAAAHTMLSMMGMVIESRKRKWNAPVEKITYAPIEERDRMRIDYRNNKIWKNDVTSANMLRLNGTSFFHFSKHFQDCGILEDTIHMCVEQQVALFLHTISYNIRSRVVATNFGRSGETVSRYFNKVLHAVGELWNDYIKSPSMATPTKISGSSRWDPYFKMWNLTLSQHHY
jgi:hypothetical protein